MAHATTDADEIKIPEDAVRFWFDVDAEISYRYKMSWCIACSACSWPCMLPQLLCCEKQNLTDAAKAKSVYVTKDMVVFHSKGFLTSCRCDCYFVGAVEKHIPLSRVQDVNLKAPGGGCIRQVLYTVDVQTAGGSAVELHLEGLKEPYKFKELVFARKDMILNAGPQTQTMTMHTGADGVNPSTSASVAVDNRAVVAAINQLRGEVQETNAHLKKMEAMMAQGRHM